MTKSLGRVLAAALTAAALTFAVPVVSADRADAAGRGGTVAKIALAQVGKPYRHNAVGPRSFDCSGLVAYAYARAGTSVPHSSAALSHLRRVSLKSLQVGDIVGRPGHVGIYIGGG